MDQYPDTHGAVTVSVMIRQPMNDHGTTTVELEQTNETRHLVDYGSDRVRRILGGLPAGTTLPVRMTRVGARSNVWRATAVPGVPQMADARAIH